MADKTHLNKDYFDNEAWNYDTKHEKTLAQISKHIEARREFIGVQWIEDDEDDEKEQSSELQRAVRLLDYACGTGSMSRALAPYTTQCVGIDLSEKMVSVYNARARNQGLSEDEMVAFTGNLAVPDDENPTPFSDAKFFNFDIAAVGLGFHHFDDPDLAAKRLAARLKPGGVLMIIDFLPHGPHKPSEHVLHAHKAVNTITFHGFSEERISEIFVNAGVGKDFAIDRVSDVSFRGGDGNADGSIGKRTLFMARGTKG